MLLRNDAFWLQHRGRKWCSIPLDFRADLILKSAKMTEIDRISLVLLSIHINWEGKSNVLPISVISADLRIKSARKSSGMEHHLRPLCFRQSGFTSPPIIVNSTIIFSPSNTKDDDGWTPIYLACLTDARPKKKIDKEALGVKCKCRSVVVW